MKSVSRYFMAVLTCLLLVPAAFAQGTTGALTGTVTNEGAPLPGVTVSVTSPSLQGTRVAVTDVNGNYNFPALPPGDYTVVFEMEGLSTVSRNTRVALAGTQRVNADLTVSTVTEAITVTASAPAVLETTEVQTNLQREEIDNLPIQRTIQASVQMAPGVTPNGPAGAVVISGANAFDSLYLINGAVTNENLRGQTDNLFIEDAIEETTVLTGSISAEYGRFTGGVVSSITKSGGNEFSGSLRDTLEDPAWTDETALETDRPSDLNHTFEGTLGGRIIRDRLWFFGAGRFAERTLPNTYSDGYAAFDPTISTDERWELKLTGALTPEHNLTASYMDYTVDQTPHCAFGCFDDTTIDQNGRQLPREMITANYNGIITDRFLVEAGYSTRSLAFENSGGESFDRVQGTWAYDLTDFGGAWGAPIFCGVCDPETRENEYYNVKGTYFLATQALGTHNVVGGYENFAESRLSNNYQSGSNYAIYVYGMAPQREADGSFRPILSEGDILYYTPINQLSLGSEFVTDSFFVNDKWDLNPNWSFNLGLRYDMNNGVDSIGNTVASDSYLSPRLGAIWDIAGDGRFRVNASYGKYVSKIQETVGGGASAGGNPAFIGYEYRGPQIGGIGTGLDSFGVIGALFDWFDAQGGLDATDLIVFADIPGLTTVFRENLQSPNMDEWTIGFGTQVGTRGFVRADYINRDWNDFYATRTAVGDTVTDEFGQQFDVREIVNTNDYERTYDAVLVQGSYRLLDRLNLGANYTWSETRGNFEGETAGNGPIAGSIYEYQQYQSYAQNNPTGLLSSDQTHKLRAWLAYDVFTGPFGNLNLSVLQRFDTGTPYSEVRTVDVGSYVTNPGFITPPSSNTYYFSERGEYRWDDVTATDIGINYSLPVGPVSLFAQGDIVNVFNEDAQIAGATGITLLEDFNPLTETPVEGVHWQRSSNFGAARSQFDYQQPRTYRVSFGARF